MQKFGAGPKNKMRFMDTRIRVRKFKNKVFGDHELFWLHLPNTSKEILTQIWIEQLPISRQAQIKFNKEKDNVSFYPGWNLITITQNEVSSAEALSLKSYLEDLLESFPKMESSIAKANTTNIKI